jgi:hypothetical protein
VPYIALSSNQTTTPAYFQYTNSTSQLDVFSSGAIDFQTGGFSASKMRLDSSGNLGLGVTPSAWESTAKAFQFGSVGYVARGSSGQTMLGYNNYLNTSNQYIYSTTTQASRYEQVSGEHRWFTAPSGTAGNTITFTQAMTLDASGNLGVGVTNPGAKLEVYGGASGTVTNVQVGNASTAFLLGVDGSNNCQLRTAQSVNMLFYTAATERARITSGGDFVVTRAAGGDTTVGSTLYADGTVTCARSSSNNSDLNLYVYSTGAAAARFYVGMGGTVYATNTTISAISDQRFKENIQNLDVGLEKIMALKPRKFDWKSGKGKDIKGDRGFIAQELEQVFPDLVDEWADPAPDGEEPYKSVRQDLIPVLVKAIQEQQAIIEQLKADVAALKGA